MWPGLWLAAGFVLLVGAIPPGIWLSVRGSAPERIIGLQLVGSAGGLTLVAISLGVSRPDYLIVPLVLVLLTFAGTLVYTRLTGESDG
ncbi:hypothetical protein IU500_00015 [Nocardia terpenica]|uniref:monovalent cation/H+ antiporter complex subunit F n=1 Tax=Nocardia terpenica TaxID=455432 RepID=UPI0018943C98|nr:monovalent cation/H+ antiporter complex subunit F [Nocardia terpenica]MBF6060039.1 hypothetical protein [Nocardia terpenica]MBF6102420.1 hypothetical protein [Nocardia terpenica]MBF6111389.1 hypothetical protein [Nocardia terpenica]MBF6117520.1 hypothetical protein [Nocardia terpenica]MBF6150639.1 hypothetical protein [Nocardia terpenica]